MDIFPVDVVVPANTTILEASFTLIDDKVMECDEAFGFALVYKCCQPGVSLRPGSSSGNLTIVDDDGRKTLLNMYIILTMQLQLCSCMPVWNSYIPQIGSTE